MRIIWGRLNSHNVKKVVWFADELGLDYERRDMGGQFGTDDAYVAKNPNRLVPTIEEDDGFILWESNAIIRYWAHRLGGDRWLPADHTVRARADRWMDWQFQYAEAQRPLFVGLIRTPPEQRDVARMERSAAKASELMTIVDATLAVQPWLSGDAFGIGDIPMGVYAHTYFTLPIERPDVPHVRAWYERLTERTAYARSVMIPLT